MGRSWTWLITWIALFGVAVACNFPVRPPTSTPAPTETPVPTPTLFVLPSPAPGIPYPEVNGMFSSICFKFLEPRAGQIFTLNSQADLNAFYDQVSQSKLCLDAVIRQKFDFSSQRIIGTVII